MRHGVPGIELSAVFYGRAFFHKAATGYATFEEAVFHDHAVFFDARFAGDQHTSFEAADFHGDADFHVAHFFADVCFDAATFHHAARFGQATFHRSAWFDNRPKQSDSAIYTSGSRGSATFHGDGK